MVLSVIYFMLSMELSSPYVCSGYIHVMYISSLVKVGN